MVTKTGLSLPEDLDSEIRDAQPEEMSFSEFCAVLLADGLTVRDVMIDDLDRDWDSEMDRRMELRQALLDWAERDRDGNL